MLTLNDSTRRRTFKAAFGHFGVTYPNSRHVPWAGQSSDGRAVVTLWADRFVDGRTYSIFGHELHKWVHEPKARKRTSILKSVGVGGTFESIILRAVDTAAYPRTAKEKHIGPTMRVTDFKEETGEFSAEPVAPE
jgi:hypothetical protein